MIANLIATMSNLENKVIYDTQGNPNIMVKIPKFNLSDVIDGAPATPHPAFIVNGVTKDFIYVSKYTNSNVGGTPCSHPNKDPYVSINFANAKTRSASKGAGWHLMTNAEYGAIALLAQKNATIPRGNKSQGLDGFGGKGTPGKVAAITLAGSGPATWSHSNNVNGIYDLAGNVTEWLDGVEVVDGRIKTVTNNNYSDTPVNTTTYFDKFLTYFGFNNAKTTTDTGTVIESYGNIKGISGYVVPELYKYLALMPHGSVVGTRFDYCRVSFAAGVTYAITRGGDAYDTNAGFFNFNLTGKTGVASSIGFRTVYIE